MKDNTEIRWTVPMADAYILTASGHPYGNPPDVAAYLHNTFRKKGLQEFLQRGTRSQLEVVHTLLCANVQDGSLSGISTEEMDLLTFSAMKIAEKLSNLTGKDWVALEPYPKEKVL